VTSAFHDLSMHANVQKIRKYEIWGGGGGYGSLNFIHKLLNINKEDKDLKRTRARAHTHTHTHSVWCAYHPKSSSLRS
jgi:hypothetical protein